VLETGNKELQEKTRLEPEHHQGAQELRTTVDDANKRGTPHLCRSSGKRVAGEGNRDIRQNNIEPKVTIGAKALGNT